MSSEQDRERMLALLTENHTFPGGFEFRVVVRPEAQAAVVSALVASLGGDQHLIGVTERPSRNGRFVALRLEAHVAGADAVLQVWAVLRGVDGVVTML